MRRQSKQTVGENDEGSYWDLRSRNRQILGTEDKDLKVEGSEEASATGSKTEKEEKEQEIESEKEEQKEQKEQKENQEKVYKEIKAGQ